MSFVLTPNLLCGQQGIRVSLCVPWSGQQFCRSSILSVLFCAYSWKHLGGRAASKELRELLRWHYGVRLAFYLCGTLCWVHSSGKMWESLGLAVDSQQSRSLPCPSKSAVGCGTALPIASGAVRREECHRLQASFCDLKWHVIVAWVQKKLRSDVSKIPSHKTYPATSSYSRQNPALL